MLGQVVTQFVHFYPEDDEDIIKQIANSIEQAVLLEYRMMEIINAENDDEF